MNCIKLLLLDFDGTLADTRRANTLAYVTALGEAGYALTEEEYSARYFGMRCNEFLTRLGIADPAERERLRLRKIALYPTFFDTLRLNTPLWEFCRQFQAQGGRVWVVSTGSRANIDNVMRHLGIGGPAADGAEIKIAAGKTDATTTDTRTAPGNALTTGPNAGTAPEKAPTTGPDIGTAPGNALTTRPDAGTAASRSLAAGTDAEAPLGRVDGILSGADVEHPKPAPDCFLEAMRREGCTPRETLIFEDSPIGIEAARRSGASYIVVKL